MENSNSEPLYHYCSNDAFFSIIESGSIRLSDLNQSNDSAEGRWVLKVLETIWQNHLKKDQIDKLLKIVESSLGTLGGLGFCLSKERDRLSQWRGYAEMGKGVCIGFKQEELQKLIFELGDLDISLENVLYEDKEIKFDMEKRATKIANIFKRCIPEELSYDGEMADGKDEETGKPKKELNSEIDKLLLDSMYCYKNPAFQEENEMRIIKKIIIFDLGQVFPKNDLKYKAETDRIKPYFELHFDASCLISEVILGPINMTPDHVVRDFLRNNNLPIGMEISRSDATLQ
jgi:hypothetical protein